jgi:hypothetical protein
VPAEYASDLLGRVTLIAAISSGAPRAPSSLGVDVLYFLLFILLVLVIVFAVLSFAVHHLFLIGLVIAGIFLLAHGGYLSRRRT